MADDNALFPMLATQMFDVPLLVEPHKASLVASAFAPRIFGAGSIAMLDGAVVPKADGYEAKPTPMASILGEELSDRLIANKSGYGKYKGIAIISVLGTLARRGAYVGQSSGVTTYEGLRAQLKAAAADDEMKAIALEIDSHGGEAAGAMELADLIRSIRATKPVYAFLSENAHSAAYAIASQATHIVIPEFGSTGSIGVVMMHADRTAELEQKGVKVTIIRSGEKKVQGNPYEALPDELRASWQASCDKIWVKFCTTVGAGRGNRLTSDKAMSLQAACFEGAEAVKLGLADEVADPKEAFDEMVAAVDENGVWKGASFSEVAPAAAGGVVSIVVPTVGVAASHVAALIGKKTTEAMVTVGEPLAAEMNSGPGRLNRVMETQTTQETTMSKENEKGAGAKRTAQTDEPEVVGTGAEAKAAQAAERNRSSKITAAVQTAGLPTSLAQTLIEDGTSLEDAGFAIINAKADASNDGGEIDNRSSGAVIGDGIDRMKAGMEAALVQRAGLSGGEQNEFTGMSLREMARHTVTSRGLIIPAGGVQAMVSLAFNPSMGGGGMHGSSDFGEILANVANKSMLRGFNEAEETFEKFTSEGTLSDFKPSKRVALDMFPSLKKVADGTEFTHGTMGDNAEQIILATYGSLFALTRHTVINDDLGAFTRIPEKMGRAARRTIGNLVFAMLAANAKMSDNKALFHTDHKNLSANGAVPSEVSINEAITAMSTQTDRGKKASALNISPKYLLAHPNNRSAVLQSLNSEYAPDDTDKAGTVKMGRAYNTVRDAAEPIFDARQDKDAWHMLADPNMHDTIEVAYLDGISTPYLEQQDGWGIDGTEFKVRIDAGVAPLAWEGLYKNPGK